MLKNSARKSVLTFSVILNRLATDQSMKNEGRVRRTLFPKLPSVSPVVGLVIVGMPKAAGFRNPSAGDTPSLVVGTPIIKLGRCCSRKLPSFWPVTTLKGVPVSALRIPEVFQPPSTPRVMEFALASFGNSYVT